MLLNHQSTYLIRALCARQQAIGKVAGTVAMGVGAAAMLSAFAVDIADVAVLGAVAGGGSHLRASWAQDPHGLCRPGGMLQPVQDNMPCRGPLGPADHLVCSAGDLAAASSAVLRSRPPCQRAFPLLRASPPPRPFTPTHHPPTFLLPCLSHPAAAGSMAALKTPSTTSSGKKAKKGGKKKASKRSPAAACAEATSGADVEAVDTEEEAQGGRQMISQKASAPGERPA